MTRNTARVHWGMLDIQQSQSSFSSNQTQNWELKTNKQNKNKNKNKVGILAQLCTRLSIRRLGMFNVSKSITLCYLYDPKVWCHHPLTESELSIRCFSNRRNGVNSPYFPSFFQSTEQCWVAIFWVAFRRKRDREADRQKRKKKKKANFVCWLLFGGRSTPLIPQWHVKTPVILPKVQVAGYT